MNPRKIKVPDLRIPRLDKNTHFMLLAHWAAIQSTCDRGPTLLFDSSRHGVGAAIVKGGCVIATGYNGSPPKVPHCSEIGHMMVSGHCVGTIHAECNAILQCAIQAISPVGSSIYTTASPCFDCSKLIIRAGIEEVFFSRAYDSRYDLSGSAQQYLLEHGVRCVHWDIMEKK